MDIWKNFSIIIPIYNESGNIIPLYDEIYKSMTQDFPKFDFEIIFVNDWSTDNSRNEICNIQQNNKDIIAINLQRNYGQSTALQVWFENCSGDLIITLDWDGQNDPKDIKKMYEKMQQENLDVIAWRRKERKDRISIRIISKCASWLRRLFINDKIHDSGCTLRIYKKECINELCLWGEMHRYITEILKIKWYKIWEIETNHRDRFLWVSKYNRKKSTKWFIDLLYIWFIAKYQSRPLHLFWWVWIITFLVWLFSFLLSICQKIWWWLSINRNGYFLVWVFLIQTWVMIFIFGIIIDILIRNYYNTSGEKRFIIKDIKK
jgi:glycosyltransferase involved in cell wall biosynthesis